MHYCLILFNVLGENYGNLKIVKRQKAKKRREMQKKPKKMNGFYGVEIEKQVKIKLPDRQCL